MLSKKWDEGRRRAMALVTAVAAGDSETSDQLLAEIQRNPEGWFIDHKTDDQLGAIMTLAWLSIGLGEMVAKLEGSDLMTVLQRSFAGVEKRLAGD